MVVHSGHEEVRIPEGGDTIGTDAFEENSISSISFPINYKDNKERGVFAQSIKSC